METIETQSERQQHAHTQGFHQRRRRIRRRGVLWLRSAPCAGRPCPARGETPRGRRQRSIVFTPQALKSLIAEVGVDRIVMGTDYPFPWPSTSVDHILNTPGLSDADRTAMLGDTAARLLGIKSN